MDSFPPALLGRSSQQPSVDDCCWLLLPPHSLLLLLLLQVPAGGHQGGAEQDHSAAPWGQPATQIPGRPILVLLLTTSSPCTRPRLLDPTWCVCPQARLLFHEAAGAISPGTVGSNSSLQRIQLLTDAYEHAAVATDLSPNSLSCAALRATLAINLLVEESALLTPTPAAQQQAAGCKMEQQPQQPPPHQLPSSSTMLDRKCQELLQRFLGSIDACKTALDHPKPVLREPLITFTTASHTTCDPCSLVSATEGLAGARWQGRNSTQTDVDTVCLESRCRQLLPLSSVAGSTFNRAVIALHCIAAAAACAVG